MLAEDGTFIFFDDLYASVLDGLANKHLKNGLDLVLVVEQERITLPDLRALGFSLRVGNKDGIGSSINTVVRIDVVLVLAIVMVAQLLQLIHILHLSHLHVLLTLFLAFTIALSFLGEASLAHLLLLLTNVSLLNSLLLNKSGVRLHVDRDD